MMYSSYFYGARHGYLYPLIFVALLSFIFACQSRENQQKKSYMNITKSYFGNVDGKDIYLFQLINHQGMVVNITNYGGIITSIVVPDKTGKFDDVALGYDSLSGYLQETPYFGAIVGRYGNRIDHGRFELYGKKYQVTANDGENHLHGGNKGFDKVVWNAEELRDSTFVGLKLTYLSKDLEEGYPGNLQTTVYYHLNDNNEITMMYEAETDAPTILNLTNHSYFNLKGAGNGDILNHELMLNASRITAVRPDLIPTGALDEVTGTDYDFTTPRKIGERIKNVLNVKVGYDNNYVLDKSGHEFSLAASVYEPESGRTLEVLTDQPGIQFYSGNFLDGSITGKNGKPYLQYYGFCLETQHFPDSPNHPFFPPVVLMPGEKYQTKTVYRFGVKRSH